jgi:hypothetical protein
MTPCIAIDPGAGGGLAWITPNGQVLAQKMPAGMTGIADLLILLAAELPGASVAMEQVHVMPGDGRVSAGAFMRHCGWLDCACYCVGLPVVQVSPQRWQAGIGVPRPPTLAKDMDQDAKRAELARRKAERKAWIKEHEQRLHPNMRVTLNTADALGILEYALKQQQSPVANMSDLPM